MPDIQKITTPEQAAAVFNEYEVFNASDWQPERRGVRSGTLLVINIYAFAVANYCAGYYRSVEAELETLRAQINAFWDSVYNSWDIEPREYFEAEIAKGIGFDDSPLAMAVHYMWKRDAKVQGLVDENERLKAALEQIRECPGTRCKHCEDVLCGALSPKPQN